MHLDQEIEKATVIEKRHGKQCAICMLIDADKKDMKWHLYKVDFMTNEDVFVCENCIDGLKDIRKRCHHKVDNPNHNSFEGFMPWFVKDVPGLRAAFEAAGK